MTKEICFDLDGTLVDFYAVDNWLPKLRAYDASPYMDATPMFSMNSLARILNNAQRNGWIIKIISWSSKNSTPDFDMEVSNAKRKWLNKHLASVKFDEINVVPYGTPKSNFGNGILFDDEKPNRDEWHGVAYDATDIIATLKEILKNES